MAIELPTIWQRIRVDDKAMGGVGSAFGRIGKSMGTAVAAGAAAAAVAVGAFTAKGVADAAKVDKGLREVNALFGRTGPAAEKAMDKLRGGVAALSDQVGIAQEVLVGGLYQAISAGVPEDNAFEFMRVASEASIAGVTDVETAVDGLTTIINAFGLEASDAQSVADSMFATVQGGKTNFAELSDSIFNIGPAAASAKVSFQEVNAAIATLTASGTPTSVATTQLRAALTGLQRPSKDLDSIFGKLGYKNAQVAIESKGLGFALDAVKDASGGSNGKLQMLLGSVEAVAAANVIAGTGAEKFTAEMDRQKHSAGAATGAFEEMQKSTSVQWDKLKVQIQNVGIAIGAAILPTLNKIIGFISDNLPGIVATFKRVFGAAAKAIAPIVDAVRGALGSFKGFGSDGPLGGIISSFLGLVGSVRATFASVFGEGTGVRGTLQTVLDTVGPIMTTIGGIIKGVLDVIRIAWEAVGDDILRFVVTAFGGVVSVIKGALKIIKGVFDVIAGIFTGDWRRVWNGVKGIFGGAWDAIKGILRTAWAAIKGIFGAALSLIGRAISGAFRGYVNFVATAIVNITGFIRSLPGRAVSALAALGSALGRTLAAAFRLAVAAVRTGVAAAIDWVRGLPGRARTALGNAATALYNAGMDLIRGLINGIKNMAASVANAAREVVGNAIDAAKSALGISSPSKKFREIGRFVGKGFVKGLTDERGAISDTTRRLAELVRDTFNNRGTRRSWARWIAEERDTLTGLARQREQIASRLAAARDRLHAAIEQRGDFASSVRENLVGAVTDLAGDDDAEVTMGSLTEGLRERIAAVTAFQADLAKLARRGLNRSVLRQLAEAGVDGGAAVADALAKGTRTELDSFNRLQSTLVTRSKSTGNLVADELYGAGIKAAQGMVAGLKAQQGAIERQMLKIATAMQRSIKRALGIRSPSKVFANLGANTALGMAQGLRGGARDVAAAVSALTDGLDTAAPKIRIDVGARRRGGDGAALPGAPRPTLAPTYNIRTYDPAETARVVAIENGWHAARARY